MDHKQQDRELLYRSRMPFTMVYLPYFNLTIVAAKRPASSFKISCLSFPTVLELPMYFPSPDRPKT